MSKVDNRQSPTDRISIDDKNELLKYWISNTKDTLEGIPEYVLCDDDGRVPIRVRVHIMTLNKINTVEQCFDARIWLQLKWKVAKSVDEIDTNNYANEWYPKVDMLNNSDKVHITDMRMRKCGRNGYCDMYMKVIAYATFMEHFELKQFPVDLQRMHIRMVLWGCPRAILKKHGNQLVEVDMPRFLVFHKGSSLIYNESFIQEDTWQLDPTVYIRQGTTPYCRNDDGVAYTTLLIYLKVHRKIGFYLYNVIFPVFVLVCLSFCSFLVEITDMQTRATITLSLLLTLVALKFNVSQYIPTTSYLTYLDKYVILSFVFISIVAAQNAICYFLGTVEQSEDTDDDSQFTKLAMKLNRYSGWVISACWIALNILAAFIIWKPVRDKYVIRDTEDKSTLIDESNEWDLPIYSSIQSPRVNIELSKLYKSKLDNLKTPSDGILLSTLGVDTNITNVTKDIEVEKLNQSIST